MARPINRELADPMDREISRTKKRDGMSADGLSYSVADDLEKQMGQALAEYDARRKDPRIDVWGKTLEEDAPANLRHELIDPLTQSFGGRSPQQQRTVAPRTYKAKNATGGDDVVSVDPLTGKTRVIYSAPGRPQEDPFFKKDISAVYDDVKVASKRVLEAGTPRQREEAYKSLEVAKKALDAFRNTPKPAAAAPAPALESPIRKPLEGYGFIGDTGGDNSFETKPSRNGRLPASLARELLDRANGDRAVAEKWAIQAGYSIE